jgi:hypothetical protein
MGKQLGARLIAEVGREELRDTMIDKTLLSGRFNSAIINFPRYRSGNHYRPLEWTARSVLTSVLFLCLSATPIFGANHYIRAGATGSSSGSDWSNAYTDIPSTLVRGDTYYLAGGTYGSHHFTSLSGTSYVYIKKATAADHGTATGWQDIYGTTQAVFDAGANCVFWLGMSYLSIDGVTGSGTNGYGIKLKTTGTTEPAGATVWINGSTPDYSILSHIECEAPYPNGNLSNFNIDEQQWPGATGLTITHCYIHGGLVSVRFTGTSEILDHCLLQNAGGQGHAEMIDVCNTQQLTIRYNVLENMVCCYGTTYIEPQVNGGQVPNGIYIYGNVVKNTTPNGDSTSNPSLFSSTSNEQCLNVFIYNNTIYNLKSLNTGYNSSGISGSSSSSTFIVRNNIWQNCAYPPTMGPGVFTADHNILNTGEASFVNAAGGDFHLAANTIPGVNLGSPYNIDPDGNVRTTWSLGAYEYNGNTNPIVSVSPGTLNFGSVGLGLSSNLTFTVKNIGGGTLSGTATVSAPFNISNGTYSLGANQSMSVNVTFTPLNSGGITNRVTFTGGGGATASVTGIGATVSQVVVPPNNVRVAGVF